MEPGAQLGHYTVLSEIGRGGMGVVWKAKDEKLGREVAIKTLPPEFAQDTDRLARFEREAKLLASLNHPNIAAIYGLEEYEGTRFLVLELVEGDTLADRLQRGAIPVEESLKLALQIAEALEAAHEKSVIHRDLKPANVKVTPDGRVKVLDFGLAKAFAGDDAKVNPANSPTLSMQATQQGVILGTAAYMSPEQASGESVDHRADVWSLGVVLYEMLTGQQLFTGKTASHVMGAVLDRTPDWDKLPANLHPKVREVLERCLEKEARDRLQGIGDVRFDLRKVLADPAGLIGPPTAEAVQIETAPQSKLPWVAAVIVVALVASIAVWFVRAPEPPAVVRFDHELPEGLQLRATGRQAVIVSPDGRQVIYNTIAGLYRLSLDEIEAQLIPGAESPRNNLTFSPDGEWIAYQMAGQIQKISVNGGAPVFLTDATGSVFGLNWGNDGTIVYSEGGTLMQVSEDGGASRTILAGGSGFAQMLPGGNALLFQTAEGQVAVYPLNAEEPRMLVQGQTPRYLSTGHIVYVVDGTLYAQVFDLGNLDVVGGPVPMVEDVMVASHPQYDVSDSGTLAYIPGTAAGGGNRSLVWVDREGNEEVVGADPRAYDHPRISPDGQQLALDANDQEQDVWVFGFARGTLSRSTFASGVDRYPVWTPDGERIAFQSQGEAPGMYWKNADNTGSVDPILLDDEDGGRIGTPYFFTPDGSQLVFREDLHPETADNIAMVAVDGDSEPQFLLSTGAAERSAELSPDGNWMAYDSDESGEPEVYVKPFPNVNDGRWQISNAGGTRPLWSRDGQELFYLQTGGVGPAKLMAVSVDTGPEFDFSTPQELLDWPYVQGGGGSGRGYDVSLDGQRFLAISPLPVEDSDAETSVPKVNIVVNWFEELKERVPVP